MDVVILVLIRCQYNNKYKTILKFKNFTLIFKCLEITFFEQLLGQYEFVKLCIFGKNTRHNQEITTYLKNFLEFFLGNSVFQQIPK